MRPHVYRPESVGQGNQRAREERPFGSRGAASCTTGSSDPTGAQTVQTLPGPSGPPVRPALRAGPVRVKQLSKRITS
jgi:hypothetical protein